MDERTRRPLRGAITTTVSMTLAVLLLAACGATDDGGDATETVEPAAATTETDAPTDLTSESSPGVVTTPSVGTAPPGLEGASPEPGVASPTPAIVVSAPPVTVPTAAATPGTALVQASPAAVGPVAGDGTGGAPAHGAPPPGTEGEGAGAPAAGPVTVSSCDVAEYPPYTGDQPTQQTTSDVNVRLGPGTDCDPVGAPIAGGVQVQVLSDPVQREGDDFTWVAVSVDGTQGWIAAEFLEPVAE